MAGEPLPYVVASAPLPRVMHEAGAAVLLVDLRTNEVVYANLQAAALAGQQRLPMPVDQWSRSAGLVSPDGRDLSDTDGPLSRVALGRPVSGELIRRVPDRADAGAEDERLRQSDLGPGVEAVEGPLWVTGFALGPGNLEHHALLVFMALSGTQSSVSGLAAAAQSDRDRDWAARSRAVIATDLAFTITDPRAEDDPLIWVNPAFERTTGYSAGEVLGRNCRFLQGPDTDPEQVRRLRAALEAHEPAMVTLLNYRKDGTAFWNQVSISPVLDADGELVNFVGVQVDVTERVEAERERERARGRLSLLAEISEALLVPDTPAALQRATELLASHLGTWAVLTVVDQHLEVVAAAGEVDRRTAVGRAVRLARGGEPGDDPAADIVNGVRKDTWVLAPGQTPPGAVSGWLVDVAAHPEQGLTVLPVRGRTGALGALLLPADLHADDRTLVLEALSRTGMAIDNARLYQREHELVEALQRSMLPGPISLPDLDVWTHYVPSVAHAQVGGDWYDVITRRDGSYALVIGDVVGHDVEAAAVMGQLRSTVRAYAYELDDPAVVLDRVDELARSMSLSRMASIAYVALTPSGSGRWRARWATAGHLPPLLRSGEEVRHLNNRVGSLIGMESPPRRSESADIEPGDVLVLFTDGLIERRGRALHLALQEVTESLMSSEGPNAERIGQDLLDGVGDDVTDDDTAVVVVRVPAERTLRDIEGSTVTLEAGPTAPAAARTFVASWLRDRGATSTLAAELVTSELVTNAVMHGRGDLELTVGRLGEGLRIEVADGDPAAPVNALPRADGGGNGLRIIGGLAHWGHTVHANGKRVWAVLDPEAEKRVVAGIPVPRRR